MTDRQIRRIKHSRQKNLNQNTCKSLLLNVIMVFVVILIALCLVPKNDEMKADKQEVNESQEFVTIKPEPTNTPSPVSSNYPEFTYSKDWDENDAYLLAKIAMAEAEGCSIDCKIHVILAVLNRVWDDEFPDTIDGVIFQKLNGIYQFTPIGNERWDRVEPNDECWQAVQMIEEAKYDISEGALFFESCEDEDNWHSRNLEFLYEIDGMRFYR